VAIVRCLDARFKDAWAAYEAHLASQGIEHVDVAQFAGGAKVVASPKDAFLASAACYQVAASLALHQPSAIVLSTHAGCGDYGKKFDSAAEERAFHENELRVAREAVRNFLSSDTCRAFVAQYFPGKSLPDKHHEIPIRLVYNDWDGFTEIA